MRYFQNAHTGKVQSVENPVLAAEFVRDPAYTEVQVVPVDAIVIDPPQVEVGLDHHSGRVSFDYGDEGHVEQVPAGISWDEFIALGLAIKASLECPPVDEAQITAVRKAIDEADLDVILDSAEVNTLARRLVERGVRVEQS